MIEPKCKQNRHDCFSIEEFLALQEKCKARGWDAERLIQFANALRFVIIKYKVNKWGHRLPYISCYKSKKAHHKIPADHRENF